LPTSLSPQVKSLLSLTGQIHTVEFPYDAVYTRTLITQTEEIVIGAMGIKGTRVVDIAVHPKFRKLGIASALVNTANVNIAYVVTDEAERFWQHIGWYYFHDAIDKGTRVKVYVKDRKVKIE